MTLVKATATVAVAYPVKELILRLLETGWRSIYILRRR